jgi:hypothetical protein
MLEPPEPPWKRKRQRGVFAGDVAIVDLRTQRLAPDRIPEPPLPDCTARVFGGVGRIVAVIAVVAMGTAGYLWRAAPQATQPSPQLALASDRADVAPGLSVSAANLEASSLDSKRAEVRPVAGGLVPGAAGDTARGVPNGATAVAAALGPSATQFNGQDSRAPAPTQVVPRQPTVKATEIAFMLQRGAELMAKGDIAAARLMFKRAAETGDAGAAFALAEAYDPWVLRKLGTRITLMSDIALAQTWYKKARDLGSTLAPERIVRLTRLPEWTRSARYSRASVTGKMTGVLVENSNTNISMVQPPK